MPRGGWLTYLRPQAGTEIPASFRLIVAAVSGATLSLSYTGLYLSIYSWVCVGILLLSLFGVRPRVAFACGEFHRAPCMDGRLEYADDARAHRTWRCRDGSFVDRRAGRPPPGAKASSSSFRARRAAQFSGGGIVSGGLVSGARRGPRGNRAHQPGPFRGQARPSCMA